ncbi:cytochrome P450, partial [Ascoidea rubescens DSM 1968]
LVIIVSIVFLVYIVINYFFGVGPSTPIQNLPQVPGLPIVGNLHQVLYNPTVTYSNWAKKYGDVYQIKLGSENIVVANSFDSVKRLWLETRTSNNSRPVLYTFHKVVSSSKGFTIGTTPFGESYKRKKKIVATSLNKKNVDDPETCNLMDCESLYLVSRIMRDLSDTKTQKNNDINVLKAVQGFALRISLYKTYGFFINLDEKSEKNWNLFDEITYVENNIGRLRSHTSNLQDYLPILRYFSLNLNNKANDFRKRRDVYMNQFMEDAKKRIENDQDNCIDCIVSNVLKSTDYFNISSDELNSICLTMVSAGLDNTPLNFNHCLGHLSQPSYGYDIQSKAVDKIIECYGDLQTAWDNAPYESFKVDYITAIVRETLRYFTVLPLCLPRATTKSIFYKGAFIPQGTIFFMNAYSANHDPEHFENPDEFIPERWLDESGKIIINGTDHFSFGAGARACVGSHLATKELYVLLIRFLIIFQMRAPDDPSMLMETDPIKLNAVPSSIAIEPREYYVKLIPR